ncbi:hypothetical protein [Actinoplanes sp. NPDC049316]|uniref:hypothetical protein n=1 Tax=Actinoplanes sp. NPDC049316 TaxID=3154727 RepID=UPI00343A6A69
MSLESDGLNVLTVTGEPALRESISRPPSEVIHAVQLEMTATDWLEPGDEGLLLRPTWIQWVAPVDHGAIDLISRQSKRRSHRTRVAVKALDAMDVQMSGPIDEKLFDEWAHLYQAQVESMRFGHDIAIRNRSSLLAADSDLFLIAWRENGRMVCGMIARFDPARSALVTRFSAVAASHRSSELPRAMYAKLADIAAQRGARWLSAGNDINFFATVCSPGLAAFKMRLGFRPVPADLLGNSSCRTVAEVVTSTAGLNLPVLRFGYRRPRSGASCLETFLDGPDALELVSVTPEGTTNALLESLPSHRRLTLAASRT